MEQGFISVLAVTMAVFAAPLFLDLALCIAGNLRPARRETAARLREIRLAVVVPAHDEETMIQRTIESLKRADGATAVFVVAHNCVDGTAASAARAGATVLELNNPRLKGKGAALRHGFKAALESGADAVLVIDADSVVSGNLIAATRVALEAGAEATQCRYELEPADPSTPLARLRRLAFRGMNVLRARGRSGLGFSAGIFGNGFAVTAEALRRVPFDADSIAEDLEYHTRLVAEGLKVAWVEEGWVHAQSPLSGAARATQEARWEGGRFRVGSRATKRLLGAVVHGRLRALETVADVWSLPVSRGILALLLTMALPVDWLHVFALGCAAIAVLYVIQSALLGQDPWRDLTALTLAPVYMGWKALITPLVLRQSRKGAAWARTKREVQP